MRASSPLIDDLSRRSTPQPGLFDTRDPDIWITLGCVVYCTAFWIGVGFGIRALIAVL